jgi:hypothetical protein
VTRLAPPPTTPDRRLLPVIVRLAVERIKAIRWHEDSAPLRRTPHAWRDLGTRYIEQRRIDTAAELRELLSLLRACGFKGKRPGRRGR